MPVWLRSVFLDPLLATLTRSILTLFPVAFAYLSIDRRFTGFPDSILAMADCEVLILSATSCWVIPASLRARINILAIWYSLESFSYSSLNWELLRSSFLIFLNSKTCNLNQ